MFTDLSTEFYGSKPVRVVLIASEETLGDYSMFLQHLLTGLVDEVVSVVLVCPANVEINSMIPHSVEVIKYPVFDLPFMGKRNRKILIEKLEKFRPNLVHCLCESQASLARLLAKNLEIPYMLTINSLRKRFRRLSVSSKRCVKVIVPSESIACEFKKTYPRLSGLLEQINIGTFVSEKGCCFNDLTKVTCLMTAYQPSKAEEFENLLCAIRHLAIDGYEFMFVAVGLGELEKEFRAMVSDLGISNMVTIVPRLQRWHAILAAGDIYIQPRPDDSYSPLLLEAMSVGNAVAACKGGVDDLIMENETAAVFDADDDLSIYDSLRELLDRKELGKRLSQNAQQYLREHHSVSQMISSIVRIYRQTANGNDM